MKHHTSNVSPTITVFHSVKQVVVGLAVVALFAISSNLYAQESVLEEIVVTAQKREQSIQDVPMSVATISGENIDAITSGSGSVTALVGRVGSLFIENSSFGRVFPRPYIRGLGNVDFDLNSSQPVSYIYDEVVYENPILKGFPLFDLDRVEVLRGPQGTLFGRNTPAGILKFESVKPAHERSGYGRVSLGRFGQLNAEGAIGGSLSEDVLAMRLSVSYKHQDDWVDNGFTGVSDFQGEYDDVAARLQFLWTPSENFDALINLHAHSLRSNQGGFHANILAPGSNAVASGRERDQMFLDGINDQTMDRFGITAKLNWDFENVTLTSVTGFETLELFSRGDVDGGFGAVFAPPFGPGFIPFSAETEDAFPDLDQFTQEIRLSNNDAERVAWQVGAFFFREEFRIESRSFDVLFAGGAENGFAVQDAETTAWAVFGHADFDLTDRFVLSAGLRYSDDDKDFTAERFVSPIGLGSSGGPISVAPDDQVVSWDLSGTYEANEDVNVYGRVARSFRAPSVQGRLLFAFGQEGVSIGDTETITSYEAGIKSELLNNRLRLNVSAYSYQVDDIQLTAVGGATNINKLVNADKANGSGFEADVTFVPSENWLITAGLSFNDTEIDDPALTVAACGANCTILDPFTQAPNPFAADGDGLDEIASIDGNNLPFAPEWMANFTLRYGKPLANGEFYFLTDWFYTSEANMFLYESVEFETEARVEAGLRVGYVFGDGKYELAAFGRNLFDEELIVSGIDFNNLGGAINDPPTWGIEGRVSF